ncbi:BTB/POZ domain-containing protein-like protein [Tanacetum coccineum]
MTFHLHKLPLTAKSKKFHDLITELETNPKHSEEEDNNEEIHETIELHRFSFPDFPGGSEAFETAVKFCYAVKIELNSSNVAALRCAGEVLEMTEEYSEDNLVSKTESFINKTVLKSVKECVKTLKSCEDLLPLAEELGIVQRCIDCIVSKANASDPGLFGWPVNEVGNSSADGGDRWFDELVYLNPLLFNRVIGAIKSRVANTVVLENCLVSYAKKHISGVNRAGGGRRSSSSSVLSEIGQKELLETIVTNLPEKNGVRSSQAVTVFFGMLRATNILNGSDACRSKLEKKIGLQLEQATLDDLLVPSYSYLAETLYDVDCVQRILTHFLHSVERVSVGDVIEEVDGGGGGGGVEEDHVRSGMLMLVGKLIDGYLSEIASDANLKPEKFLELALALPDQARVYDDGLYRSVDVYLKAHPWIKEVDREKICGVMDCQKLTLEACTHAAQNERLPLRAVVQVLFFEQLQLRQAIAGTLMNADIGPSDVERLQDMVQQDESVVEDEIERDERGIGGTWTAAVQENQVLRLDMDSMRTRVHHLERECSTMKKAIANIDKICAALEGATYFLTWKTDEVTSELINADISELKLVSSSVALLLLEGTNWDVGRIRLALVRAVGILALSFHVILPSTDWLEMPGSLILLLLVATNLFAQAFRGGWVGVGNPGFSMGCYTK